MKIFRNLNFYFLVSLFLNLFYIIYFKGDFVLSGQIYGEIGSDFLKNLFLHKDNSFLSYLLIEHAGYLALPQRLILFFLQSLNLENLVLASQIISILFVSLFYSIFCLKKFSFIIESQFYRFLFCIFIITSKNFGLISFLSFTYIYYFYFVLILFLLTNEKKFKLDIYDYPLLIILINKPISLIFFPILIFYSKKIFEKNKIFLIIAILSLLISTTSIINFYNTENLINEKITFNSFRTEIFLNSLFLNMSDSYIVNSIFFLIFLSLVIFKVEKKELFIYLFLIFIGCNIFYAITLHDGRLLSYQDFGRIFRWNIIQILLFKFIIFNIIFILKENNFIKLILILICYSLYLPHENLKFKEDEIYSPKVYSLENLNKNFDGCLLIEPAWIFSLYSKQCYFITDESKIFDIKHFKKKDKKIYYNINLGKYKNLNIIDNKYRGFRYKTTKPINERINSFLVSIKTKNNPNLNINYFINQKKNSIRLELKRNKLYFIQLYFDDQVYLNDIYDFKIKFDEEIYSGTIENEIKLILVGSYDNKK